MPSFADLARHWPVAPIRAGEKRPRGDNWNAVDAEGMPTNALTPEQAATETSIGLMHVLTMAFDMDNREGTRDFFRKRGQLEQFDELFSSEDRVGITRGDPERGKLLFSLAHLSHKQRRALRGKKVKKGNATLFELRFQSTQHKPEQDLLPGSKHPTGATYAWDLGLAADWQSPPPLPAWLLELWHELIGSKSLPSTDVPAPPAAASTSAGSSSAEHGASVDGQPDAKLIAQAQKLLADLDPSCDYDTWLRMGFALDNDLGDIGFQLWNEWSAKSEKYPGEAQLQVHWNSFGRYNGPPITLGTFRREQRATVDQFDDVDPTAEPWRDPFAEAEKHKPILRVSTMPERATLPEVQWIIAPLIARGFVTSFTGHGGAGKSTESLVMAAHVACSEQYRSFPTHAGRALIVSLEDPEHVVWLRLYRIAETCGLDIELIRQNVTVVAVDVGALIASGQDTVLATERNVGGIAELKFTPVFDEVRELARNHDLTVIDNSSDAYGANENSRPLVRAFIRGLQHHVAVPNNAGVLLLGHVDKVAARKTAAANSYSGSTAWHNSVRSRLVLTQAEDGSDAVLFTQEKNNLAKRWTGVAHYAPNEFGILVAITPEVAQQRAADALAPIMEHILAAIRSAEAAGVPVYTATSGSHTAHSVLSKQPGFPGDITAKQTNAALVELRDSRRIKAVEFRSTSRNSSTKWVVQEAGE